MSLSYFHERDLGRLGIAADIEWVGTDRLSVHLSTDSLDRLVEGYEDEERLSLRLDDAQCEGYEAGKAEVEEEWEGRLAKLQTAWQRGTADDVLEALIDFGRDLDWGHSDALHTLTGILLNQPDD